MNAGIEKCRMAFPHRVLNLARILPLPTPNVCTRIFHLVILKRYLLNKHSNMLLVIELTKLDE